MRKPNLNPQILEYLKKRTKGKISERGIRNALSDIRRDSLSLTLNAAAEIFAKKRGFTVARYLKDEDRESLKILHVEKIKIPASKPKQKKKILEIAKYDTTDILLKAHLDEINKTYTSGCYTATFVLCRKVLENLLLHHILRKKYPTNKQEDREKYFDFNKGRFLDFNDVLHTLRKNNHDFNPDKKLVERICDLSEKFKEKANDMTHSLYHIAIKKEIDDKNFGQLLYLIKTLEEKLSLGTLFAE